MKGQNTLLKSNCDEWSTPQDLFDKLNKEFKFKLDACANYKNTKHPDHWFNKRANGLIHSWSFANTVFCNPPYSDIKNWVKKCYNESMKGSTIVLLIPARVDTTYWHDYIFPYAHEIRFIRGRLRFNNHKHTSTFPSAIIIFRKGKRKKLKVISYTRT